MDNMTTIYKEDCSQSGWNHIVNNLDLPNDTYEICVKHVSHMSETKREQLKKDAEAHENKKMQYNICETCGACDGRAGNLISQEDGSHPDECINCNTTRQTGEVFISCLSRTEEEIKKTIAIIE